MTRPVNLYIISRIHDENSFNIVEMHESGKSDDHMTRYHEIESLRLLMDEFTGLGIRPSELDGFFYGFIIPRIGKEFDLLKFNDRSCLNIELKSQPVPEEQILAQLLRNRYYLSHLGVRLDLCTVVTETMDCYRLSLAGELVRSDMEQIAELVRKHAIRYRTDADSLFNASEYLVSPLSTPERFLRGEYFLTQAQEQVKRSLLKAVDAAGGKGFFHITGKPGTGKTLLVYDLARTLAANAATVIIVCGGLKDVEREISRETANLDIVTAGEVQNDAAGLFTKAGFILVDEAQRLSRPQFDKICRMAVENDQVCIFSTDPEQVLTTQEKERDIAGAIAGIPPAGVYELSEKIRMNREMAAFISALRDLSVKDEQHPNGYANVEVCYANTTAEAQELISYYRDKGYVFINYSRPSFSSSPFEGSEEDFDPRSVFGMEFDRVVMLMDSTFYYDEDGKLCGIPEPDPDLIYPNLFFQGVTRVREKLAVVIMKAPELFDKVVSILR
ncbi:MAG: DUF2075 domain-containing protein [Lachnospiraceae bacterium]|nr:DUF2075 domain-containing protein [Lachnospiraceae bacterium]